MITALASRSYYNTPFQAQALHRSSACPASFLKTHTKSAQSSGGFGSGSHSFLTASAYGYQQFSHQSEVQS
jgi:hypothetical protein